MGESRRLGHGAVNSEHLLLGLLGDGQNGAIRLLTDCGVEPAQLYRQVAASLGGEELPPRTRARSRRRGLPPTPGNWTSAPGI